VTQAVGVIAVGIAAGGLEDALAQDRLWSM